VARAAARFVDRGVVAFDLAGPEAGFPSDDHLEACKIVREAGLGLTIHGGEADGPHSMWRSLALCGAQRIGHGVHIADDTDFDGSTMNQLGSFARRVRDHRVPLEVAISSNIHTASYATVASHPFGELYRNGFNVSINTDNRLMSSTSMSQELALAHESAGISIAELGAITEATIDAGFGEWTARSRLIRDVVRPAYAVAAS